MSDSEEQVVDDPVGGDDEEEEELGSQDTDDQDEEEEEVVSIGVLSPFYRSKEWERQSYYKFLMLTCPVYFLWRLS